MSLPAPNLDDRRFQSLVDDAKRMVQRKWPEWSGWTDHNVSDPGVTLIETFAYMVDQLLYRLNQVTDLTYVKLLELIGIQLQAPTAAHVPLTFWLSAPRQTDITVPAGTEVATRSTGDGLASVSFWTTQALRIASCHLVAVASRPAGGGINDVTVQLDAGQEIALFSPVPSSGDAFYVGLSTAVPSCVVTIHVTGDVEGYGINPEAPPRRWDAWTTGGWSECDLISDATGGFNRAGDITLQVPPAHVRSDEGGKRAGWLRCVVTEPDAGENSYGSSPRVSGMRVFTIGGTVEARNAQMVRGEVLGVAEGAPGQELELQHQPVVVQPDPEVLEVVIEEVDADKRVTSRVEDWVRVEAFPDEATAGRCFVVDAMTGTLRLPPAVREPDGSVRFYGQVPPVGAVLRLVSYMHGGGRVRNVPPGTLTLLRTSIPAVSRVENRVPVTGGVDGETIEEAKRRGPLELRARDRAVTASDYEYIALQASARDLSRVRCVSLGSQEPGAVRVLLVPNVVDGPDGPWRPSMAQLVPTPETLRMVTDKLDDCRVVGVRVAVERPAYRGLTVIARLRAHRHARPDDVREEALRSLYRYYHPVIGGKNGEGWPFGRPIHAGEVHAVLRDVVGVDVVEEALLYTYDVETSARGEQPVTRIELGPDDLAFSYAHRIVVERSL